MNLSAATEQWLPIPGFVGRYEASSEGRIRAVFAWGSRPVPRIMTPRLVGGGSSQYLSVCLGQGHVGSKRTLFVHRLVAQAFLGATPSGMVVRHLNGDAEDNRAVNLSYGSQSENVMDTIAHGRHPMASRTHCHQGHPLDGDNLILRANGRRACRTCARATARKASAKYAAKKKGRLANESAA